MAVVYSDGGPQDTSPNLQPHATDVFDDAAKQQANQHAKALLYARATDYNDHLDYWKQNPEQWSQHITSGVSENTHTTLARYIPGISQYINDKHSFAGVSGGLTRAWAKALSITDPALRANAISILEGMQNLSPEDQQIWAGFLQNPDTFVSSANEGEAQHFFTGAAVDRSALGTAGNDYYTISGNNIDPNHVAAFYSLFPQFRGMFRFDEGGITFTDVKDSLWNAATPFAATIAQPLSSTPTLDYSQPLDFSGRTQYTIPAGNAGLDQVNPLSIGKTAVRTGFGVVGAAFKGVGYGADVLASHAPGPMGGALNAFNDFTGAGARLAERGMDHAAEGIGDIILAPAGLASAVNSELHGHGFVSHKFDRETTQLYGSLGLAAAMEAGGAALGAGKTASTTFAEQGAAELGAQGSVMDSINSTLDRAVSDSKIIDNLPVDESGNLAKGIVAATHPIRLLVDPAIRNIVFNVVQSIRSTGIADWVNRSQAGRVFDFIDSVRGQDDALAQVKQRYPMLPEQYVRTVLEVNREAMPQATVDYAKSIDASGLDALRKSQVAARARLSALETTSAAGPSPAVATVDIPLDQARSLLEYPERGATPRPEGQPTTPGAITIEYDPATGKGIISEGMHRVSAGAGPGITGENVSAEIKIVDTATIERQGATPTGGETPRVAEVLPQDLIDKINESNLGAHIQAQSEFATNEAALRAADLEVKMYEAEVAQKALDTNKEPFYELPGRRDAANFLHRVLYRPTTPVEMAFRGVMSPIGWLKERLWNWDRINIGNESWANAASKQPFVAKFVDKIASNASFKYVDQSAPLNERVAAHEQNIQIAQRLFQRFGIPVDDYTPVLQKILDADSYQSFYDVMSQDVFGSDGLLARNMPKNTPKAYRDAITGFSDNNPLNYRNGIAVGTHNEPVTFYDNNGSIQPLPTAPSEFASQYRLPSPTDIENVLSSWKRWARNAQDAANAGSRGAAWTYNAASAVLKATTVALKVPILVLNVPAIILTKTLDEMLGNISSPNLRRVVTPGNADFIISPDLVGNTIAGFFDISSSSREIVDVSRAQIASRGLEGMTSAAQTLAKRLIDLHDDPMLSAFVRTGLDLEQMKALVSEGGDWHDFYQRNVVPQLEKAGITQTEWLQRWHDSLDQATFGSHPDFMKFVADGHVGGAAGDIWHAGRPVSEQFTELQSEIADVRSRLADLDPKAASDAPRIRALQAQLKDKLAAAQHLQELAAQAEDAGVILDRPNITRTHPQELANEITRRFAGNELELPATVRVERPVGSDFSGVKSLPDVANDVSNKIAEYMYGKDGPVSLRAIGRAEARFARGSFFSQRAEQFYEGYRAAGMDEATARAFAAEKAGAITKDLFYDLTARSTVERQVRNIFWFAPVNAELLYRWLYALPAQNGGWLPGFALQAARFANWNKLLMEAGIVHKDAVTGQEVIPIPGVASIISHLSGGFVKVPGIEQIPLVSLNPHLSGPIPELAPIPASALNRLADNIPILKHVANVIAPYSDVTFVPYSIRNLLGIAGKNPADVSNDFVNQQWDRTHDLAYQYAFVDLQQKGDTAPQIRDFQADPSVPPTDAETAAYTTAWGQWFDRLSADAASFARGIYVMKTISSSFLPGTIQSTSAEREDYQKFFTDNILPDIQANQYDNTTRAKLNEWLAAHPDSMAFNISYNAYTGKQIPPTLKDTNDQNYYRSLYEQGVKGALSPDDYAQLLGAVSSRNLYFARANANISAISPKGDWTEVVKNWYQRSSAINDAQQQWDLYLKLHPEADAILKKNSAAYAAANDLPAKSIEVQYVTEAMTSMKALSGVFTGDSGLPDAEFQKALSQIKALNAELYQQTGGRLTPMEQGISDYFGQVVTPYMQATKPLYDKAAALTAAGQDPSAVYQQIDSIKSQYSNKSIGGVPAPSIDEFFFGAKDPQSQQYAITHWQTQPISWLSDFQRQKAGYTSFAGEDKMWQDAQSIRDQANQIIDQRGYTPSSTGYDSVMKWRDRNLANLARTYGPAGTQAMRLDMADPYKRLETTGFASNNASMQQIFGWVDYVHQRLQALGENPGGYSSDAIALKQWLYTNIRGISSADPSVQPFLDQLSFSSKPDANGNHPTGVPLYEAIFFGVYNSAYIPQTFITNVGAI